MAKTPHEKKAVAKERTDFANAHLHQKLGEKFLINVPDMSRVPVELLHHLYLNLPKMLFKWLIRRHLTHARRRMGARSHGRDTKSCESGRESCNGRTYSVWYNTVPTAATVRSPGRYMPSPTNFLIVLLEHGTMPVDLQ